MADPNPADPFAQWRELVAQWEKSVNEASNQAMGSEQFSGAMNRMTSQWLAMQQAMGETVSRYQAAANLPSRADIAGLGERLRAIEETLNRLAQAVDRLASPAGAPPVDPARPPRTRKPPGKPPGENA